MYSLRRWRMLPPSGSPLSLSALRRGLAARGRGAAALYALESELRRAFGVEHLFLAGSGRQALSGLFQALKRLRPERDEVLIPAYVSFSVPSAVVNAGCRAALYDLDPLTLKPNLQSLGAALSERTLAVLICPQFGLPFTAARIAELCRKAGAFLVDDAAQSMGATVEGGVLSGLQGDAGIFSLSRGKPMTAVDGGIVLTRDAGIAGSISSADGGADASRPAYPVLLLKTLALMALRMPSLYRIPASMPWLKIGASIFEPDFAFKEFSAFQAGLASYGLSRLQAVNGGRRENAAFYIRALSANPTFRAITHENGSTPVYLRLPVIPDDAFTRARDAAVTPWNMTLGHQARRLGISPGFPLALDQIPALAAHLAPTQKQSSESAFAGAHFLAANLITLPTHDQIGPKDRADILNFLQVKSAGPGAASTPLQRAKTDAGAGACSSGLTAGDQS